MINDRVHCEAVSYTHLDVYKRQRKKGRVHLVALPGYSPELNPVELLWSQLKRDLKNQVFLSLEDLAEVLIEKLEEFRKDTKLII